MNLSEKVFQKDKLDQVPTRNGYGEGLVLAGKEDENVVVLGADLSESTRVSMFKKEFPERFIQCGIAEQNMMNTAAGLALAGKIPFVSTYAVFSPGMNWAQLRVSVIQSDANVKVAGAHAGVSVGPDGMSHQALEDIAITRCLPDLVVLAPCDFIETRKATLAAAKYEGPVYLRFAREKTPVFTTDKTPFEIGRAQIFKEGKDAAVIACGPVVHEALLAAHDLEKEKISVAVVNNPSVKPMDEETIIETAKKTGAVVTAEDHQVMGGMGGAVCEILSKNMPVPVEMIGVQDRWGESGTPEELMKEFGLVAENIKEAIKKVLERK